MGIQVYEATHNGQGLSLPAIERQFISFSYGGRNIEDFGLLAVFSNNRLEKSAYTEFTDITSKNDGVDGQTYWGSYLNAGYLNFTLATDGMTSKQFEDFKYYFREGNIEELVLTEYPNRAIKARVSAAPTISMLPFEDISTVPINGVNYTTRTTMYKGEIKLSFVMDDPHWYARESYINKSNGFTEDELRIILEDGIPTKNMFNGSFLCFLGDNNYFSGSSIGTNSGLYVSSGSSIYLYNCGSTYAVPALSFDLTIQQLENYAYIGTALNGATLSIGNNSIAFTAPSLITSYNKAIEIVNNEGVVDGIDMLELRQNIRDNMYNYYARAWAMYIIDSCITNSTNGVNQGALINASTFKSHFNTKMKDFLPSKISVVVNNKTGISSYSAGVKVALYGGEEITKNITENAGDMIVNNYLKIEGNTKPSSAGTITSSNCLPVKVNCGFSNLQIDYRYTYL